MVVKQGKDRVKLFKLHDTDYWVFEEDEIRLRNAIRLGFLKILIEKSEVNMKKIIFIPILLFIFCTTTAYSTIEYRYKQHIKSNIYKALTLVDSKKIKKQWTRRNINKLATVLIAAENYTDIPHKELLSTILTESDMDIYSVSGPNRNGTFDVSLVQQNSPYLKSRYNAAKKILDRAGIDYSNNLFDISVNVMSGAVVLKDFKKQLKRRGVTNKYAHVVAYNVGPSGFFKKKLAPKKRAYLRRYKRFLTRL